MVMTGQRHHRVSPCRESGTILRNSMLSKYLANVRYWPKADIALNILDDMKKTRYLVGHDYGQGCFWCYVHAESPQQIEDKFHDIKVFAETPKWMTAEDQSRQPTYDIDNPGGWLVKFIKNQSGSKQL